MRSKKTVRRLSVTIFAAMLLMAAFYTVAVNMIEYATVAELDGRIFFTGRVFGRSVFGIKSRNGVLGATLLDKPGNVPDIMLTAYRGQEGYVVTFGTGGMSIYSKDGVKKKVDLKGTNIKGACTSDLDGDKTSEIIILTSDTPREYADEMVILALDNTDGKAVGVKEVYRFKCGDLNPWKVQTADVDGDGKAEISLGVYKTAPFHPEMAKRPFIYNWTGEGGMFPKWRGSRLSRPFDDYIFGDIESNGMDEIISVETAADGRKVLTSYLWKGFGFEKTAESDRFEYVSELKCNGKEIVAKIRDKDSSYWGVFIVEEGKLILKSKSFKRIW